ncbi:MAG: ribonuclease III [Acidobacteria bacterium]|nr:MAG: ribonuclease III [Acidobacteriota bacterium]
MHDLESALGYSFTNTLLLTQSLTHSSHANEKSTGERDNEQLEFLGDSVLGFLVSDYLFRAHPNLTEGQLSRLKGFFVSSANLVKYAERVHLGSYLQLGKGEEKTGGRMKQALLVDGLEAVLGAIYLDGGMDEARRVMLRFLEPQMEDVGGSERQLTDFKTELQEQLQSGHLGRAEYIIASEQGPDHQKLFTVEVMIEGESVARGVGLTKKAAEQAAARHALERLWAVQEKSSEALTKNG